MNQILITGVTGAFGEYLIESFLRHEDVHLTLLVRGKSQEEAIARMGTYSTNKRIEIFCADLSRPNFDLNPERYKDLQFRVTDVVHAAASTRFTHPLEEARKRNVDTTRMILEFVSGCTQLKRFGYVSSALVAGKRTGLILEDDFEHSQGFINSYEQSKYEAESLVRKAMRENTIPTVIFRPPLVISKPRSDYQGPVNLLSHSLNLLKKDRLPLLPGTKESVFDIVDGTATADAIAVLMLKETLRYTTYHLSNGARALTAGNMLRMLEEYLGRKIKTKFCGDMSTFKRKLLWEVIRRPWLRIVYKKTESYLPELAYPKTFDNKHLLEELNNDHFGPPPENVFRTILE